MKSPVMKIMSCGEGTLTEMVISGTPSTATTTTLTITTKEMFETETEGHHTGMRGTSVNEHTSFKSENQ